MDSYIATNADASVRHLLHNLRNARALRSNPLVSHLLQPAENGTSGDSLSDRAVVSRVSEAVAAVLRTLSPAQGNPFDDDRPHRQSEIIRRCVLGSQPYKAVAHDLGISLRTLFRDLDGIRLHLVEALPRYAVPSATVTEAADTFELELRHAQLLRNIGRFDEALQVLDRLAGDASSAIQRARAWNAEAITHVDSGRTEQAEATLGRARVTLSGVDDEPGSRTLVECDVDLTDAMIARVHGDTNVAMHRYQSAADRSGPMLPDNAVLATDVHVRALAQSAIIQWLTGDLEASARTVDRAWTAIEWLPDPPDAAHYSLLTASSLVRLVCNGDIPWAIREMSAAAVLAERHGMMHDALMALGYLSYLERLNGNARGALATCRRTLAIARNSMAGTEFGLLCATAAEIEADSGNAVGAMQLIEEGRSRVARGGSAWARLQLAEADTLNAAGKHAEAIVAAQKAADGMQRQGKSGFVGSAFLMKAKAHVRRGENAEALLATREALPMLEQFGKSVELVEAYDLSARLTGNRTHRANARDLQKLLRG